MKNYPAEIWREHKKVHRYLGKQGTLITWTQVFVAPEGFEHQIPYFVGIIEFDNEERIPLEVVDCTETNLTENIPVKTIIRRIGKTDPEGVIRYGIKVTPV